MPEINPIERFVKVYGWDKTVRLFNLIDENFKGKTPVFLIAKELGAIEWEIADIISELSNWLGEE